MALYSSWLAQSYIQMREIDEAVKTATRSLTLSARVNSARGEDRVAFLRAQLKPYRDVKAVQDFQEFYRIVST